MNNHEFIEYLKSLNACHRAIKWVKTHGGTAAECWHDCEHGDWMAWLAAHINNTTQQQLVDVLADCAALALKYYEAIYPDDKRVRNCINTCRRYAKGKATMEELIAAADAAYAAADAVNVIPAAAAAAYAAHAAAHAANATAYAATYVTSSNKILAKCAKIFRKHFPDLFGDEK